MFVDGPFLFQHDFAPVHKARSIKTWLDECGVEELEWPAQISHRNTQSFPRRVEAVIAAKS